MEQKEPTLVTDGSAITKTGLVHRVLVPEAAAPHPTVVMLHGRFGNEDVMWVFARTLPSNWLIIAPRAIVPEQGGYSWHPFGPEWPQLSNFDEAVTAVSHFIYALPEQYHADPEQIYLMGFSQGAAAAFATAMHYPGIVQGIAGLVGFMPNSNKNMLQSTPLKDLPVLLLIGEQDEFVPLEISRKSSEAIRAAGAQLEYHEYNTGHKLNGDGMRKLKSWWAEFSSGELEQGERLGD